MDKRFMEIMEQRKAGQTDDEPYSGWNKMTADRNREVRARLQQYNQRLKVDALLMRDELRSRVLLHDAPQIDSLYEFPIGSGALDARENRRRPGEYGQETSALGHLGLEFTVQ